MVTLGERGDREFPASGTVSAPQRLCQEGSVLWLEIGLSLQGEARVAAASWEADHRELNSGKGPGHCVECFSGSP